MNTNSSSTENLPPPPALSSEPVSIPPSPESIYLQLSTYPFDTDPEFLSGLAAILGHTETTATPEELTANEDLVLQARCFYLTRKLGLEQPIEVEKYLEWSQTRGDLVQNSAAEATRTTAIESPSATIATTVSSQPPSSSAPQTEEPPYPTSFAQIVDLITRNLPIPGIEEIPTTVLEPGTSRIDKTPRRKKPWEKEENEAGEGQEEHGTQVAQTPTTIDCENDGGESSNIDQTTEAKSLNGHITSGEGVVKILQPNAIPDNGLLSKD